MFEISSILKLISNKIIIIENNKLKKYQIITLTFLILFLLNLFKLIYKYFIFFYIIYYTIITILLNIIFFIILLLFIILFKKYFNLLLNEYLLYNKIISLLEKEEINIFEYILYRVDYYWSKDRRFKSYILLFIIIILILIGGIIWRIFISEDIIESLWIIWTYLADPGTHANNKGFVQRIISFCMTIGGMIIFALVIGIVSDDLSAFVDKLREGKSRVIVTNHTLILGQVSFIIYLI